MTLLCISLPSYEGDQAGLPTWIRVRPSIGIAFTGSAYRYFVNDIIRIYSADLFTEWLSHPETHICLAVSRAAEEVLIRRCSTDEYYNRAEERGQNRRRAQRGHWRDYGDISTSETQVYR